MQPWFNAANGFGLLLFSTLIGCGQAVATPDMSLRPDLTVTFPEGCNNGVKDGQETDTDCGGGTCSPCAVGLGCAGGSDCATGVCVNQRCVMAGCGDGIKNGDETDVDCGGSCPNKCGEGRRCVGASDCQSATCANNQCTAPPCANRVKDGLETDVDCGGGECMACGDGKACEVNSDCTSSSCVQKVCQPAGNCQDGKKNGSETDVDCGGGCPKCADGKSCSIAGDCQSGMCTGGVCKSNETIIGNNVPLPQSISFNGNIPNALQYSVPKNVTLVRMGAYNAMGWMGNALLALYSDKNNEPDTLIVTSAPKAYGMGVLELPVNPTALQAGKYWVILYSDNGFMVGFDSVQGQPGILCNVNGPAIPFGPPPPSFPKPVDCQTVRLNMWMVVK